MDSLSFLLTVETTLRGGIHVQVFVAAGGTGGGALHLQRLLTMNIAETTNTAAATVAEGSVSVLALAFLHETLTIMTPFLFVALLLRLKTNLPLHLHL